MNRPLFVIYTRPWWQRPWGIGVTVGLAAAVPSCIVWSTTTVVVPASPQTSWTHSEASLQTPPRPAGAAAPLPEPSAVDAPAIAPFSTPHAVSTEIAPGVHVTPIGLPPTGMTQQVATRTEDSEPEN